MPLSDTACRGAKPGEKQRKMADGGGMYLLVKPTGGRLWRLDYRFGGKSNTLSFGAYPEVSLADARERRLQARTLLAQGIDPSTRRGKLGAAPAGDSFEELAREWYAKRYKVRNKYAEFGALAAGARHLSRDRRQAHRRDRSARDPRRAAESRGARCP